MRTKEEILESYLAHPVFEENYLPLDEMKSTPEWDATMKAMDEYAKEVHFAFKKWVDEIVVNGGDNMYRLMKVNSEELFDKFLSEQQSLKQ